MFCIIMYENANLDKYSEFVTNKVRIFEVIERKSIKFILLFFILILFFIPLHGFSEII